MPRRTWYILLNSVVLAWAVAAAIVAIAHRFVPAAGWLMVHLTLLGAASSAILIWSQHFADTLLRHQAIGGRRSHAMRLALHTAGVIVVVAGMLTRAWPVVVVGAAVVVLAAILHAASLFQQLRSALPSRFGHLVRYYIAAGGCLMVGVTLGVLMARADVAAEAHDRLYLAHITFNVLGWIGLTVLGTVILLWPTVLHARIAPGSDGIGSRALILLVFGLVVAGASAAGDIRIGVPVGLGVYLVGVVLLLIEAAAQARQSPPVTYAGWSMGAALIWMFGTVAAMAVVVGSADSWAHAVSSMNELMLPFVVGFVVQIVAGALSYLLPVVLGGGPSVTKQTNRELDRGAVFRIVVINAGLLLYLLPLPSLVRVTLSLLVFGVLLSFLVLGIRAVVVARRASAGPDAAAQWAAGGNAALGRAPRAAAHPAGPTPAAAASVQSPGLPAAAASASARPSASVRSTGSAVAAPPRTRSGMLVAAAGALAIAVTIGVALDPAGAGIGIAPTNNVTPTGHTTTVKMVMKDMRFHPDVIDVPVGDTLVIELSNADPTVHDLVLASGVSSDRMAPGASEVVDAGVIGTDLDGWCSVAGHRQMGMVFKVVAVGAEPGGQNGAAGNGAGENGAGEGSSPTGGSTMPSDHAMHTNAPGPSAAKDIDLMKSPAADFVPYDAKLEPAASVTTHQVTLTVSDTETEVAPGIRQRLWTYNGTAPGPTLRGHVGDRFEVTLVNDGTIGHSIDFHAGSLAPDKPMRTIDPGERLTYNFTATRSGIWLYHCSTMPMSLHIANGMFGAVIIDPAGLTPVDSEFVLVQSEYYLGPQGDIADMDRVTAGTPDLVTFNGYADQYRYRPLEVTAGERVRVWVLDAGPNLPEAFHIIGGQFDTVFKEGEYLLKNGGSTGSGGSQVLGLAAAQGGFVELTFPEAGHYSFVNHSMIEAERGAAGVFHVTG